MKQRKLIVTADKGKIEQVIYNLIDNAIKFSLMILKLLSDYTTIAINYSALSKTMELVFPMIILIKSGSVFIRQTLQEVWIKPVPGLGFPL